MFNKNEKVLYLPKNFANDSDSARVAAIGRICILADVKIKQIDSQSYKDQDTADDMEAFWIGMCCSFFEGTTARRYKTRDEDLSNGITAGIALQMRGAVI